MQIGKKTRKHKLLRYFYFECSRYLSSFKEEQELLASVDACKDRHLTGFPSREGSLLHNQPRWERREKEYKPQLSRGIIPLIEHQRM